MSDPAIVFVHAHPDDECILTGATLAKAASLRLRTIVVYGTRGDAGQTNADLDGEPLGDRRVREAQAACAELGVARVEWLPYADSGMADADSNGNPDAFSNTDPAAVATRIATLLAGESIGAVVGYDANGTYGHPDHVQVHHVARETARVVGADWALDATYNREYLAALPDSDGSLDPTFAAAEADLTHFVQGRDWFEAKASAIRHHTSQLPEDWDRREPPVEWFASRFSTEWFIARSPTGAAGLGRLADLFEPKSAWPGPLAVS